MPDNPTSRIDTLMRDYDQPDSPGASVLVMRNGEVVFHKGYGLANLEDRTAASSSTHYRLASVTKQFTAAAIMTLVADGKLSYDDSIRKYLPTLPPWADAITIRHVLTHTSGMTDYEDVMPAGQKEQLHDIDVLHILEKEPSTYFQPGKSYRYSNSGYSLLSLIVERVSGMSFADFLRERIFLPLGMKTTVAHQDGVDTVVDRAYGYSRNERPPGWHRTDQSLTSAVLGDGGIYTSVDELVYWIRALERGQFGEAWYPRVDTDKAGVRYGYGWRISQYKDRRMIWHTGESIGFRNALVRFPEDHLAVVVLTNRDEGEPVKLAEQIADVVLAAHR